MSRDPNKENLSWFAPWLEPKLSFLIFLHTWSFWNFVHHRMKIFKWFVWFTNFFCVGNFSYTIINLEKIILSGENKVILSIDYEFIRGCLHLVTSSNENLQMVCLVHWLSLGEDSGTCPTLLLVWRKASS